MRESDTSATVPAASANPALIGRLIDEKYRVQALLGYGGMGEVYRAKHEGTERIVALKVIAPHLTSRHTLVERFRREAKAVGRLRHPNVVNVFDFGIATHGGASIAYLAMEFLEGETLAEVIQRCGRLPVALTLDIVRQIALALDEAHRQGVLHRDVKPANVCLVPSERGGLVVKVLDFGVAKLFDAMPASSTGAEGEAPPQIRHTTAAPQREETLTLHGVVVGSPAYMSPEQRRGDPVDERADVFGLGATVHHMLTGVPRDRDPKALDRPELGIPVAVAASIRWALSELPEERPSSAGAFYRCLRANAGGLLLLRRDARSAVASSTRSGRRSSDAIHLAFGAVALGVFAALAWGATLPHPVRVALTLGVWGALFALALLCGAFVSGLAALDMARSTGVMRAVGRVLASEAAGAARAPRHWWSALHRGLRPAAGTLFVAPVAAVERLTGQAAWVRARSIAAPVSALAAQCGRRRLAVAAFSVLLFQCAAVVGALIIDNAPRGESEDLGIRALRIIALGIVALLPAGVMARANRRLGTAAAMLYTHCRQLQDGAAGELPPAPEVTRKYWRPPVARAASLASALATLAAIGLVSQLPAMVLPIAVMGDEVLTTRLLLGLGCDANGQVFGGSDDDFLGFAAASSSRQMVVLLLDAGADVDRTDPTGASALMGAALLGRLDVVRLLLERGADARRTNESGRTALHFAAFGSSDAIAALLLEHGAIVDAHAGDGKTPLMNAALAGNVDAARFLLAHGADPHATDNGGRTALDIARERRHVDVVRMLETLEH